MINEQQVVDFLEENPSFFIRHDALLETLHLPHRRAAGASSFLQHQLKQAQSQNSGLTDRLHELIERAERNAQLFDRLNALVIALLKSSSAQCLTVLSEQTKALFNVDEFLLLTAQSDAHVFWQQHSLVKFNNIRPNASEINPQESQALFGMDSLRSACAIPLGDKGDQGVIVLGSEDSTRFVSQLDTSLLEQYGNMAEAALALSGNE